METENTTNTEAPVEAVATDGSTPAAPVAATPVVEKKPVPPLHRQFQERVANTVERIKSIIEKMQDWRSGVTSDGAEVFDVVRADLNAVIPQLQKVEGLIAMVPETWKAPAIKVKQIDPASFVVNNSYRLVGQTAKDEPINAKYAVKLLEVDVNTKRGKVLAEDGSTIRIPLRDLETI